ncbi:transposase [Plastoroseomonas arctica]|uniref:Transposase n=1 Tax=Plastoroseomonas arctica TaxID=1509237 RepID=A0AAF1JYV2_9PROT|nr:transposase [Plastoroseomonas arctica]MBR0657259.1 transposase [Plastoroseomonas arctica]
MRTPILPLSDAAWAALLPHIHRTPSTPGRPIPDLRARFDALFAAVTSGKRWTHYEAPGATPTPTLHRHFGRLAHAGLWARLLALLASKDCPAPIKSLAAAIHAAHRRTIRILGLPAILVARRLHIHEALPAPSWLLPDPDLSETVRGLLKTIVMDYLHPQALAHLRLCKALLRTAGGRARIPSCLRTL